MRAGHNRWLLNKCVTGIIEVNEYSFTSMIPSFLPQYY